MKPLKFPKSAKILKTNLEIKNDKLVNYSPWSSAKILCHPSVLVNG